MTRSAPTQRSMASGEISPPLYARNDYIRNQTGLRTARGFLPMVEGGITRAPGTWYRGRSKGDQRPRLIPFQFAADDALILEFTPGKMRVWRYGALVMKAGAPYELSVPFNAAAIARMTYVQSADVIYIADGTRPIQRLARYALDDWEIGDVTFKYGPFLTQNLDEGVTLRMTIGSGGSVATGLIAEGGDVFTSDHVGALFRIEAEHYTSIPLWTGNTTMQIGTYVRYDGNIYRLVRPVNAGETPATSYFIGDTEFVFAAGDTVSTGVNPPIHTEGTQQVSQDPKVWWRYASSGVGIVRVTAVADARNASIQVIRGLPNNLSTDPTYRWSEGAWSDLRGYPSCVEIYDQHLVAAATTTDPRTLWFSAGGDYTNFEPGVDADSSFAYAISGQSTMNRIIGLRAGRNGLHVFALGQEFSTRSDTKQQIIGPTTTVIGLDSSYGSSLAPSIAPDGDPIFISRDGRRVIQISYSFQDDANRAVDLSRASAHFGEEIFSQIVWQGSPQRLAWVMLETGDALVMLHNPEEEVLGWARIPLAGGKLENIAVTPGSDAGVDVVTLAVRREIGGESLCCIEDVADIFSAALATDFYNINHLYCGFKIPEGGAATASFSVPHLAGEAVYAWTDAGEFGPIEVSASGDVELPAAPSRGVIGLFDDTHYFETLDLVAASPEGNMMGRLRRIMARVGLGVLRTAQGYLRAVERDVPGPTRIGERRPIVPVPVSSDLTNIYSGNLSVDAESGQAMQVSLRIEPQGGAPLTITQITATVSEAGR